MGITNADFTCSMNRKDNLRIKFYDTLSPLLIATEAGRETQISLTYNDAFAAGSRLVLETMHKADPDPEAVRALAYQLLAKANGPVTEPVKKTTAPQFQNLSPLARKVYQHMQRAGSISAREAMADMGITSASLARRICDIEGEGFAITRDRKTHPVTGQNYTRYSLASLQLAA